MAAACGLTAEDVYDFIAENGGKVTNRDLVKHFKKYLNGSDRQADARAKFTEIVNTVATVKPEDNVKYLILKKDFKKPKCSDGDAVPADFNGVAIRGNSESVTSRTHSSTYDPYVSDINLPLQNVPTTPSKSTMASGPWSPDLPPGHTPQPPPRRKSSRGKENRGTKHEESAKQLVEENDMQDTRGGGRHQEDIIEVVSPGSVKEKAQKLNRMASEIDLTQKGINGNNYSNRRRDHRHEKGTDDDDTCSVTTLDPRRKEWVISASRADYHSLAKMLKEEPRLANCKDFNSYTALHWAAKHGNLDVIKLMAGTHKVNSNARTSGGYTPLHLAAMFDREEIMEVLINTYGADPNLRDFSGKRPVHYLPKNQAERFSTLFPNISSNESLSARHCSKDIRTSGFHRIGSLNSKVKKTSVILAGGRAITRMKSWGSADNIQDRNLMPPPKLFPKKKKSRRQQEYLGITETGVKMRSGDSDSDSNYSGPSS